MDMSRSQGRADQILMSLQELRGNPATPANVAAALDNMNEAYVDRFGKELKLVKDGAAQRQIRARCRHLLRGIATRPRSRRSRCVTPSTTTPSRCLMPAYSSARLSFLIALAGSDCSRRPPAPAWSIMVRRRVCKPIVDLTATMKRLAGGDITGEIAGAGHSVPIVFPKRPPFPRLPGRVSVTVDIEQLHRRIAALEAENARLSALAAADNSELERAETALADSEQRYRTLFNSIDEGFCIIEFFDGPHGPLSDYVHIEANPAYAQHAGIPNVVGQKLREMVPDEADGWVELYGGVLRTGVADPLRARTRRHRTPSRTGRLPDRACQPPPGRGAVPGHHRAQARRARRTQHLNETLEARVAEAHRRAQARRGGACASRRRWRRSASSPAASRTTSTTC